MNEPSQSEREFVAKLKDLIGSVAPAVSGVTKASIAYEAALVLKELSDQLNLSPEKRNLSAPLNKLTDPDWLKTLATSGVVIDVDRILRLSEELAAQHLKSPPTRA